MQSESLLKYRMILLRTSSRVESGSECIHDRELLVSSEAAPLTSHIAAPDPVHAARAVVPRPGAGAREWIRWEYGKLTENCSAPL